MPDSNAYKATIGSVEISPDGTTAESVVAELHVDMMGMAEVTITDQSKFADVKIGQDMKVCFGGQDDPAFTGVVAEIRVALAKGKTSMRIVGFDPLVKLYASRTSKAFESQTDTDIVSAVISAAGGQAATDSTSGTSDYVIQRNESNLTFAKRLAARNNYHLRASADGKIEFKAAQFSGSPKDITFEEVVSLEYRMSTIDVPPSVEVIGWDYVDKIKITGKADSGKVDVIGGGKNVVTDGAQLLWKGPSHVADVLVSTQSGADAMASAELNRAARNFLRGVARIVGDGSIAPGSLIKFSGSEAGFNPTGYVISVRHMIDSTGFISEIHFISNTYPE